MENPNDQAILASSYLLCREYLLGSCSYGSRCKFAHDSSDVQEKLKLVAAEKAKRQARLRGVCHVFANGGTCSFGDKCRFAHVTGEEVDVVTTQIEMRKRKNLERKQRRQQRSSTVSLNGPSSNIYDTVCHDRLSFRDMITAKITSLPQYDSFKALYDQSIEVIVAWEKRFEADSRVWTRIVKGGGTRMIKELVESAPVIDRVMRHLQCCSRKVTIIDLCSGFGFLSMFLSDMLPSDKVHKIVMVDKGWSRTALSASKPFIKTASSPMTRQTAPATATSTPMDEIHFIRNDSPVRSDAALGIQDEPSYEEEVGVKDGRDYISSDHFTGTPPPAPHIIHIALSSPCLFIFIQHRLNDLLIGINYDKWPIPLEASKQDIKSRATLRSMQKVIFDRAARVVGSGSGGHHTSFTLQAEPELPTDVLIGKGDVEEDGIILLGVHLCGLLSLRAIDMFNANATRVELFALKPCCLPNTSHIKKSGTFAIGRHVIPCVEVCAAGKWVGNAVDGAWAGPPRNHLVGRFHSWTRHLSLGIDICDECTSSGSVGDDGAAVEDGATARPDSEGGANDIAIGIERMCSVTRQKNCGRWQYRWGSKSIEEFKVQEIGYQNIYIFAERIKPATCVS